MSNTNSTNARSAELHAGKILLVAFLLPSIVTFALNQMAAPVGLVAVPAVISIVLLFVALGGYSARRRRENSAHSQ